jgi:hypothetical protein
VLISSILNDNESLGRMTSPGVDTPPVSPAVQSTTRSQCMRAGVTAKYYRRNSGEVESSPLYSAWFREEIIADQRLDLACVSDQNVLYFKIEHVKRQICFGLTFLDISRT